MQKAIAWLCALGVGGYAVYAGELAVYFGDVDARAFAAAQAERHLQPPPAEPGRHRVTVVESRRIVPSAGMPAELNDGRAHNNLDAVRFGGRVYLAWRSAADHFADAGAVIHVASSADERSWRAEASYSLGCDLREPRLLPLGASLFLYVSRLSGSAYSWHPEGVSAAEKRAGRWSALEPMLGANTIVWRARVENGHAFLLTYANAGEVYKFYPAPIDVQVMTSDDGRSWRPLDPAHPTVYRGGGSEADFAAAPDRRLFAVIRNEAGDARGWGSLVCHARASRWSDWSCRTDPRKFDSPLMFWHDGEAYLIARRNLTETGRYDIATETRILRTARNELAYIREAKRCSLWRYVQGEDRIAFVMDLPSRGDTCYPAKVGTGADGEIAIYDYSSDLDGPDLPWAAGQRRPTTIYRHLLRFERR